MTATSNVGQPNNVMSLGSQTNDDIGRQFHRAATSAGGQQLDESCKPEKSKILSGNVIDWLSTWYVLQAKKDDPGQQRHRVESSILHTTKYVIGHRSAKERQESCKPKKIMISGGNVIGRPTTWWYRAATLWGGRQYDKSCKPKNYDIGQRYQRAANNVMSLTKVMTKNDVIGRQRSYWAANKLMGERQNHRTVNNVKSLVFQAKKWW